MVCPRIGWGGGGEGKLGLHLESNSHPWGELIGTHNSLYCNTERLQRVFFFGDKVMVPKNFVHFPKCGRHILAGYLAWLAI